MSGSTSGRTVAIYEHNLRHATPFLEAFAQGLRAHGLEPQVRPLDDVRDADLAVFWGHRRRHIIAHQQKIGRPYLVVERGYVGDRFTFTSLGYNGLNGRARWVHRHGIRPDRWERHFAGLMKPWQENRGYVLVMGQVPGDASLAPLADRGAGAFERWATDTVRHLQKTQDLPVKYRPHPNCAGHRLGADVEIADGSLDDALAGAALVVTFNSNSGVDAALAGVPVVACDAGSMARAVAAHKVGGETIRPPRESWAWWLAYCQWHPDEIASGEAWEHICLW